MCNVHDVGRTFNVVYANNRKLHQNTNIKNMMMIVKNPISLLPETEIEKRNNSRRFS